MPSNSKLFYPPFPCPFSAQFLVIITKNVLPREKRKMKQIRKASTAMNQQQYCAHNYHHTVHTNFMLVLASEVDVVFWYYFLNGGSIYPAGHNSQITRLQSICRVKHVVRIYSSYCERNKQRSFTQAIEIKIYTPLR